MGAGKCAKGAHVLLPFAPMRLLRSRPRFSVCVSSVFVRRVDDDRTVDYTAARVPYKRSTQMPLEVTLRCWYWRYDTIFGNDWNDSPRCTMYVRRPCRVLCGCHSCSCDYCCCRVVVAIVVVVVSSFSKIHMQMAHNTVCAVHSALCYCFALSYILTISILWHQKREVYILNWSLLLVSVSFASSFAWCRAPNPIRPPHAGLSSSSLRLATVFGRHRCRFVCCCPITDCRFYLHFATHRFYVRYVRLYKWWKFWYVIWIYVYATYIFQTCSNNNNNRMRDFQGRHIGVWACGWAMRWE